MPHEHDNQSFRELQSFKFQEQRLTPAFRQFVQTCIWPHLNLPGYKRGEKLDLATHMVNMLVWTSKEKEGGCVSDSRDHHATGAKLRSQVWDAIVTAGYARIALGSEASGKVTRYRATMKLLRLRKSWPLELITDLTLEHGTDLEEPSEFTLLVVRRGKIDLSTGHSLPDHEHHKPLSIPKLQRARAQRGEDGNPDPRAIENGLDYLRGIENTIEKINRMNTSHAWQAERIVCLKPRRTTIIQPNIVLRRIYTGGLNRGGRFYTCGPWSAQNLTHEERKTLRIDGEEIAELDFSGMAPRLAYVHSKAVPPLGDIYQTDKVFPAYYALENASESNKATLRDVIKRATNVCFNTTSRRKAKLAVVNLINEHSEAKFIKSVIRNTEQMDSISDLVQRVEAAHPALADKFFVAEGFELMRIESTIMAFIMYDFLLKGKPILPIHDAVVCKRSDAEFARETMHAMHWKLSCGEPVIKRVI